MKFSATAAHAKNSRTDQAISAIKQGIQQCNAFVRGLNDNGEHFEFNDKSYPASELRRSAVLVVLRYNEGDDDSDCWDVLLTLRPRHMRFHAGLVCLPGGKVEPEEDAVTCALREAHEEVKLHPNDVEVISVFEPTITIGNTTVQPVISILKNTSLKLQANTGEVEEIFWMPLSEFLKSENYRLRVFPLVYGEYLNFPVHYFDYSPPDDTNIYTVWGLTARILMLTSSIVYGRRPAFVTTLPNSPADPLMSGYLPSNIHGHTASKL